MLKLHTSFFIPKPSSAVIWRKNANCRHMFETVHLERRCPPVLQFQTCDARIAKVFHGTRSIKLNNLSNKLTHDIPFHRLTGQRFVLRLSFDWHVFDFVRNISDARDRVRMTRQTEGVHSIKTFVWAKFHNANIRKTRNDCTTHPIWFPPFLLMSFISATALSGQDRLNDASPHSSISWFHFTIAYIKYF
jgi:hypothetical protein